MSQQQPSTSDGQDDLPDVDRSPSLSRAAFFGRVTALMDELRRAEDEGGIESLAQVLNQRDEWRLSALHWAVIGEQPDTLRALLSKRGCIDPAPIDRFGFTPLHYACGRYFRSVDDVSAFLECGADPSVRNPTDSTPLHAAALLAKVRVFPVLLRAGADPNARDSQGRTPLMLCKDDVTREAMIGSWKEVESASILAPLMGVDSAVSLLSAVQQPDLPHSEFWTMVHMDRTKPLRTKYLSVNPELACLCDQYHLTPLHWAAACNSETTADALLVAGADASVLAHGNLSVVYVTVLAGAFLALKRILQAPISVQIINEPFQGTGHTPLSLATTKGDEKVITLLLSAGADRSVRGANQQSPEQLAKDEAIAKLVREFDLHSFEQEKMASLRFSCSGCGKKAEVRWCAKCHNACYCSRECQTAHWPTHKTHCSLVVFVPAQEIFTDGRKRMATKDVEVEAVEGLYEFIVKIQSPIVSSLPPEMMQNVHVYGPLVYNKNKHIKFRVLTEASAKKILRVMGPENKIYCKAHLSLDFAGVVLAPEKRTPVQDW